MPDADALLLTLFGRGWIVTSMMHSASDTTITIRHISIAGVYDEIAKVCADTRYEALADLVKQTEPDDCPLCDEPVLVAAMREALWACIAEIEQAHSENYPSCDGIGCPTCGAAEAARATLKERA